MTTGWSQLLWIGLAFFAIAALYSSVGFGGGSSYLALLALVLPNFLEVKTTALLCNLVVVSGSTYLYLKQGLVDWKQFLPLALCSVPAAFLGATIPLTQHTFFISLGLVLALSGLLLFLPFFRKTTAETQPIIRKRPYVLSFLLGGGSGFMSGLVGIGGGILLAPFLHLLRWDAPKKIAALASFFILLNSISGLAGLAFAGKFAVSPITTPILLLAVLVGGQLGARLSLNLLPAPAIKGITGLLVFYIGFKLVVRYTWGLEV